MTTLMSGVKIIQHKKKRREKSVEQRKSSISEEQTRRLKTRVIGIHQKFKSYEPPQPTIEEDPHAEQCITEENYKECPTYPKCPKSIETEKERRILLRRESQEELILLEREAAHRMSCYKAVLDNFKRRIVRMKSDEGGCSSGSSRERSRHGSGSNKHGSGNNRHGRSEVGSYKYKEDIDITRDMEEYKYTEEEVRVEEVDKVEDGSLSIEKLASLVTGVNFSGATQSTILSPSLLTKQDQDTKNIINEVDEDQELTYCRSSKNSKNKEFPQSPMSFKLEMEQQLNNERMGVRDTIGTLLSYYEEEEEEEEDEEYDSQEEMDSVLNDSSIFYSNKEREAQRRVKENLDRIRNPHSRTLTKPIIPKKSERVILYIYIYILYLGLQPLFYLLVILTLYIVSYMGCG